MCIASSHQKIYIHKLNHHWGQRQIKTIQNKTKQIQIPIVLAMQSGLYKLLANTTSSHGHYSSNDNDMIPESHIIYFFWLFVLVVIS